MTGPMSESLGLPAGAAPGAIVLPQPPRDPGGVATVSPDTTGGQGLPSLTPDSPYQPLSLPQVATPPGLSSALPEQEPIRDLGATNKAGAFAYIANQALRGAVQGYDVHQQRKAAQFNKKMDALGGLEKQLGQQYRDAYNEVGSTPKADGSLPTPQEILDDPKVKALHNQALAVHQATLGAINSYLPPLTTDKKTGKQKEKKNILQRVMDHGDNPDDALRAYSEAATQLGPTAFYQVATPQQLQAMAERRKGMAAGQAADTATAQIDAKKAGLQSELVAAEQSGDQARIDKAKKALEDFSEATSPYHRPTADENKREDYRAAVTGGYKGSFEQWTAEQSAAGRRAGAPPKPLKYDNTAGTVVDQQSGKTYYPWQIDLPLDVASEFKAADAQAFKKQQRALQVVAARGSALLSSKVVQAVDPQNPSQTIYMRALDAIKQGVPTTSSVWYKLEMPTGQERARADLAVSAREQLNTMDQILTKHPEMFGPAAGRKIEFEKWIGSQDPDAQRFATAARIASDHLAGVFGGRSEAALKGIYDAIGQNKTNPQAAVAALEQMNIAAAAIQGRGAGAIPPAAGAGGAGPTTTPPASSPSGKFDVTDPKGKVHHFDSQEQADHFKQLAGIK